MPLMLPRTLDDLRPEWFSAALGSRWPGTVVTAADVTRVVEGTSTKARVALTYGDAADGRPDAVWVKAGLDPEMFTIIGLAGLYAAEARVFDLFAETLEGRAPVCWFAEADDDGQGVVLLEDLDRPDVTFGITTSPLSPDRAAEGLAVLAGLHAAHWQDPALAHHGWLELPVQPGTVAEAHFRSLDAGVVAQTFAGPRGSEVPAEANDPERVVAAFWAWAAGLDEGPFTLLHGDAHLGNWYWSASDGLRLLDWQTVRRGRWAQDFTYFLISALTVEDRRAAELDLLAEYLGRLRAAGVDAPTDAAALLDYRRHVPYGLMAWIFSLDEMQSFDVNATHVTRFATALADLETFAALGV